MWMKGGARWRTGIKREMILKEVKHVRGIRRRETSEQNSHSQIECLKNQRLIISSELHFRKNQQERSFYTRPANIVARNGKYIKCRNASKCFEYFDERKDNDMKK